MNELDPIDQKRLLMMIMEKGLENEQFLSSICDIYDCSQSQLKIVLKSVIYDYQKELDDKI